ncbi:MAG TPA: hypothetical protein VEK33_18745 [Terriglobales bacterium]|nr:hypothetical protein [Terriglobales bacterium]
MISLADSTVDLRLSREEPESKATSMLRVGARYFIRLWLTFAVLVGTPNL